MSATTDVLDSWITSITEWLKTPFNTQGSALNWVLFVGLMIAILWFWNRVLIDLSGEL